MLVFISVFWLTAKLALGSECISNCTVGPFAFGERFHLRDGQCEKHEIDSECTIRTIYKYHEQTYSVEFGQERSSADFIYLSSTPYLSYTKNHFCTEGADCVLENLQNQIDKMVARPYNAENIFSQMSEFIDNPNRDGSIECYTKTNQIAQCPLDYNCGLSYDFENEEIRASGCQYSPGHRARIFIYDSEYYKAFHVECTMDLCNDLTTLAKVRMIFADNRLTNATDGDVEPKTYNAAQKQTFSVLVFFSILFYFFK